MRSVKTSVLLGLLLTAAGAAFAQQGSAEIRGSVLDPQGGVLPGATIVIRNEETGMFRQVTSGVDGTYFITNVTPGVYELSGTLDGFKKSSRRGVRLEVGRTASIDLRLEVGSLQEELTVTAEAPLVDVTSKEVGGNITSRELTDLPSINRNYVGFIGLLPGVVPNISTESFGSDSINVNGQDARNNNFALDGANNNDDVIGQRAGTQTRTPLEAIQEFQVLTSQYDAEFGRTTGAVVNAVTKQGGNSFHGNAFAYLQDASLTEKDFFAKQNDLPKPDTTRQEFGFTLGGPIVKDRAHFFASVERVRIDDGVTINVPARPDLNATTTEETRVWNTLVRFDHQINPNHTWSVRWLREYSPQFNQIIGNVTLAASREEDDTDQTVVAALNSTFGSTRFNSLRLTFTQEDVAFANPGFNGNGRRQDILAPSLAYLTYTDQQNSVAQARVNNAFQIEDTFAWFIPGKTGDHNIRFGAQYQYSTNDFTGQDNMNGTFTFRTNSAFDPNDFRTYPERLTIRVPGPLEFEMNAHFFGAFVQDKWRVNDRLTLSLGARYDLERIPIQELDNPAFANPDDYPVDKNNIAPRVGFSYDLSGDGRTVVRGGYGRFYDKTHFELITALITAGVFSDSFVAQFPANAADPGPSSGRRPNDPLLANGPTVNRAVLAQMFPAGSRSRNGGTVFLDSPDRRIPYSDQVSVGFERALAADFSVSADYVHAWGRDQFMSLDLNPGLRVNTTRTGQVVRNNPGFTNFTTAVFTRVNTGRTDYDALQLQAEKRWSKNYRFRLSYTLSYSRGNTGGGFPPQSPFQLGGDMQLDLNEGPTDFDRRHNLVFSGAAIVPGTGGLTFSTVLRYLSGEAFTIHDTNVDPNRNGILFDPLPAGSYSGVGRNGFSVDSDGGRNGAYGPSFLQWDVRLGYQFRFGDRRLDVFGEVFNLANRANFNEPTGDRRSTNFLILTDLQAGAVPRTAQLGVKVSF